MEVSDRPKNSTKSILIPVAVWLIIIYYKPCMGSESNIKEFSITTEMPWEEFQRISSTYLGGGVTQLCCMTRGESGRGSLVALREGHDWVNLMANVRKCCRSGDYKELRVMNVRSLPRGL